jgi:hypothetical protein
MNPFFSKIKLDLSDIDFTTISGNLHQQYDSSFNVYTIDPENSKKYVEHLPEKVQLYVKKISYVEIVDSEFRPHRDIGDTILNYYFSDEMAITSFWSSIPKTKVIWMSAEISTTGHRSILTYDQNELEFETSFQAAPHSCYLLHTGEIHSISPAKSQIRKILQFHFQTGMTYNQVYNILKLNNCIEQDY